MALMRTIAPNEKGTRIVIGQVTITIVRVGPTNSYLAFDGPVDVPIRVIPDKANNPA